MPLQDAAPAGRTARPTWLRHWAEPPLSGLGPPQLYLDRPQRLLLAAATGVALTVFAGGVVLALGTRGPVPVLVLQGLLYALVLLVAGELIPRARARRWGARPV